VSSSITYTTTLEVRRETAEHLAGLLAAHRLAVGTRTGRRALGPFKQAVLVLRWFLDGTRIRQLATGNHLGKSTAYDYPHEGIDVLAAQAPDLADALGSRLPDRPGADLLVGGDPRGIAVDLDPRPYSLLLFTD
jgi:hypothetical protein